MVKNTKFILLVFITSFSFCSIDIITTNDMHGFIDEQTANFINPNYPPIIIGGSGYIQYVNEIKKESNNQLLILDGGNFFQGHPLGIIDSGRTMIEWMNEVGYNALVPGANDFLFGVENLIELSKKSEFEFLSANLYFENNDVLVFTPYKIFNINNINIAVLGLVNPNIKELVLLSNSKNIKISPTIETLNYWIPILKENNADIIILLTSAGVPWDREEVYQNFIDNKTTAIFNAIELGYFATGVDVIISGGISKGYKSPWYDPYSHVFTFQNYGNGTSFGHFSINYNEDTKLFSGFNYKVNNSISQTLFLHDFSFDAYYYDWIKNQSTNAVNSIYTQTNWNTSIPPDDADLEIELLEKYNDWDVPNLNLDQNFEIITWNCEFFPTADEQTIKALSEIIQDMDVDMIAFQEIKKRSWFSKLMQYLPDYDFVISQQSSFMDQAIIYKKKDFILVNRIELFSENDYNFAGRPPLKVDFIHKISGEKFSVINLHMKCCDSGLSRRKKASKMLYDYLDIEIQYNENLIVLGDWNDDLKDANGEHCFEPFLNDERFFFPTLDITYDITQASYPKEPYVSFLDHILLSYSFLNNKTYNVYTIPIDDYMGGFDIYEKYISDHMPVYLSFPY